MVHSVRVSWVCALAALVALSVGCGGDDDDDGAGASGKGGAAAGSSGKGTAGSAGGGDVDFGTDPKRNDVTAATICDRVAHILCAGEQNCCDAPGREFAACKTENVSSCMKNLTPEMIAGDARVGFNASGASMAVKMLEDRAKACDPKIAGWAASSEGFGRALDGTVAAGGDCEPKGGAMNASTTELAIALSSCKTADKLACFGMGDDWKCTARSAKGGKCSIDSNCVDGLYCDGAGDFDGAGTCTERRAGGAECTEDTHCSSFICNSGKCAADSDMQAAYCLD